jgi:hypothetical protein
MFQLRGLVQALGFPEGNAAWPAIPKRPITAATAI